MNDRNLVRSDLFVSQIPSATTLKPEKTSLPSPFSPFVLLGGRRECRRSLIMFPRSHSSCSLFPERMRERKRSLSLFSRSQSSRSLFPGRSYLVVAEKSADTPSVCSHVLILYSHEEKENANAPSSCSHVLRVLVVCSH